MGAVRRIRHCCALAVLAVGLVVFASCTPAIASSRREVGVGRADSTPPTGYYMMGWVRSDARVIGQQTRLWARAIVLKRGDRKVALVSEDLNGIPGGMMATAAGRVPGFSQRNVLDSASHTHAAPTGFYNFPTYNTVFNTINSPTDFQLTGSLDPRLYAFEDRHGPATHLVERAIRRRGHVTRGQDVIDAYGNTDEGDQSAGVDHWGPAVADHVGTVEARKFMAAWRQAGRHMNRAPDLDLRW